MALIKNQSLSTEEIWNEFNFDLRKFIKSRLRDNSIVDDIIQNVFFKIHSNIHQLKDNSKLGSWLFQIARNSLTDYFRKEQKAKKVIAELDNEKDFSVETTSKDILTYCMDYFISKLPAPYSDAIIFTEYKGNTQVDLAKKENISISAAKSRVQRARAKLKELILKYSHFESERQGIDISNLTEHCPICKK